MRFKFQRLFFFSVPFLALGFIANEEAACAAPSVSSVSGSTVSGGLLRIQGANFGSHQLNIEWLGGNDGPIEQGSVGQNFSRSRWTALSEQSNTVPKYSTTQKHSGSKSIFCNGGDSNTFNSIIMYDLSSNLAQGEEFYITWWVYCTTSGSGQWKMFRLNHTNGWSDTDPEIPMFNWNPGSQGMKQFVVRSGGDVTYWLGPDGGDNSKQYPGRNTWNRVDMYLKMSSGSAANGKVDLYTHWPGTKIEQVFDPSSSRSWPNIKTGGMRYCVWQNYFGNGLEGTAYIDDVYIQRGTRARVEFGDKATWSACTSREIQYPTAWSSNAISVDVNVGAFSSGKTVYLYVVDAAGAVNANGYPVTIGSDGPVADYPNSPTSLRIK